MTVKTINIAKDYSRYPAGRYAKDGPASGEDFREKFLIPAIAGNDEFIEVIFDGARGLASSFLEEAFGGLVRRGHSSEEVLRRFKFSAKDQSIVEEVKSYIRAQQV